jgi:hypothetical protein
MKKWATSARYHCSSVMIVLLNFVNVSWREQKLSKYDQLPQWVQSQNGSEFCQYNDLPEETRSQLRQEDKFTSTAGGFRYTVKDYNGKWLVFRRNVTTSAKTSSSCSTGNIFEIKLMALVDANECLQGDKCEYQIFGSDPVKIINNDVFVLMVKLAGDSQK